MTRFFAAVLPLFAATAFAQIDGDHVDVAQYGTKYQSDGAQHIKLAADGIEEEATIRAEGAQPESMGYVQMSFGAQSIPLSLIGLDGWLLVDTPFASVPMRFDVDGSIEFTVPLTKTEFAKHSFSVYMQVIAVERDEKGPRLALSNGLRFDFAPETTDPTTPSETGGVRTPSDEGRVVQQPTRASADR